jgi:hypothetical protein
MTEAQFKALAQLLRLRTGPAQEAAALVFVDGQAVADAARVVGMTYQDAYAAVQRVRAGLELARKAVT